MQYQTKAKAVSKAVCKVQGSGFKKITEAYYAAHNYRAELKPKFYSDAASFQVTLYNLNYGVSEKVLIGFENLSIQNAIDRLNATKSTKEKARGLFSQMKFDGIFGRNDIMWITGFSIHHK